MISRFALISIVLISGLVVGCGNSDGVTDPGIPPPIITSVTPADGAQKVPIDAVITATFSKLIDTATINTSSFSIDGNVVGVVTYANQVATYTPNQNLEYNKTYNALVTTDVTDVLGIPLFQAKSWQFSTDAGQIMPLAIGNWWEYQQNRYDVPGGTPDSATYDTISIIRDTLIASERWYIDNLGNIMTNRSDGLWKISALNQMYLYIKFPASLNEVYSGNPDSSQGMKVTSLGVTKTTLTGFYICHEYTELYGGQADLKILSYYKPTLGLVVWESYDIQLPDIGITKTRQLLHFNIQ